MGAAVVAAGGDRRPARVRREAAAAGALALLLYLLTLAANHGEAEDGVTYAAGVREGTAAELSIAPHLAYSWVSWALYNAVRGLGYDGGPLLVMQVMNACLGALGLALLWHLMRAAVPGRTAAFVACGVLGTSFGYWFYSAEAEVYVLSAVLLVACLWAAWRAALEPSLGRFALLGALNGLAVLGHDTNVLFALVVAAVLFLVRGEVARALLLRCGAVYAAAAVAVVVPPYAAAIVGLGFSPGEAYDWLTGYAQSGQWGKTDATNVPKAAVGAGRALVGGHSVFALIDKDTASGALQGKLLREELFMARDTSKAAGAAVLAPVLVVLGGLAMAARGWLRGRALDDRQRTLAWLCAAWLVAYVPFFVWWEPANVEFWIAPWIAAAVLVSLALEKGGGRLVGPVMVGALFLVNLLGSVLPLADESRDYWRERVAWYEANAGPRDLVVTDGYIWSAYVRYFGATRVLDLADLRDPALAREAIASRARALGAERVLLSEMVLDPGGDRYSSCEEVEEACAKAPALRAALLPGSRRLASAPLETVWELRLPDAEPRRPSGP